MGFKGFTLNTPPEEEAHILAEDDAAIYQSIFGEDGVFAIGDRMKATVINNNQVRVGNGVLCVGGHIGRTVYGDYSDMTIENGEISKNRNDIITAIFSTTGEKGIDKFKIEVKKGTPGDVAEDPEITKENLYEGGKLRELPLWRVKLEGINIIGVEQMFKIIPKIPDLEEMIESVNGNLFFKSGESIDLTGLVLDGYITQSGTRIVLSIPVGKKLDHIKTAKTNLVTGIVRQNGKYLLGTTENGHGFSSNQGTFLILKDVGVLRWQYDLSSAPDEVVNNDLVSVHFNSGTINLN